MITIREATTADSAQLTLLSQQLGYAISNQQTLKNINAIQQSKYDEIFVAVYEDKVIGWMGMSYKISLESPPSCEIHGLVIDEQFRRQGIGKMLLEKAKQWSLDNGVNKLRLRCNTKRAEAILFYQKAGFTETKEQKVLDMKLNS